MASATERPTSAERLVHLWEKRDTPEAKQLFSYTMVSVVSTAVSFGVLALVFGVLHLWGEIGSTVFANVVATVPSYYLNRKWVWGKGGRSHLMKEIVPFWAHVGPRHRRLHRRRGPGPAHRHGPPPQPLRADRLVLAGQRRSRSASSGC